MAYPIAFRNRPTKESGNSRPTANLADFVGRRVISLRALKGDCHPIFRDEKHLQEYSFENGRPTAYRVCVRASSPTRPKIGRLKSLQFAEGS
jgi:hypothetical protein